ncbi:hypothetical protein QBC38DRAFT_229301 [Podospora fimiseda]|uniref:Secreted protein n=1 Tax=Podospora fimiseda TaxID=252190 RepID=A0AAN7BMQ7_9PEZI|nr:hypothetical protein QBC38DRAFT_229301 [Podospora fimiseda]
MVFFFIIFNIFFTVQSAVLHITDCRMHIGSCMCVSVCKPQSRQKKKKPRGSGALSAVRDGNCVLLKDSNIRFGVNAEERPWGLGAVHFPLFAYIRKCRPSYSISACAENDSKTCWKRGQSDTPHAGAWNTRKRAMTVGLDAWKCEVCEVVVAKPL